MKHLLILISIILLSSPVIGQETGILYLYESSSGFVWKTFGNKNLQPKYEGEITNGKPDGFGFMTYPYGGKSVMGEWKNGKEWNTKHTKKDGTFIGRFENGEWIVSWGVFYIGIRSGKVDLYEEKWDAIESEDNKDYGTYEGGIKNRLPNGQGTITIFGASKYVGEFKLGERIGHGTKTYPDGRKYVGEFKDGLLNGQGTYTNPDGRKFVGEFKNGVLNGQGTYTNPDGTKYVGEYKDGVMNGQGTFTYLNGVNYVGEFKDGLPNGQGIKTFPDGKKYLGEFKDGLTNGQGTLTLPNGEKYVGEFKDGKEHGQGTLTFPDGGKSVGEFKDEDMWTGKF